MLWPLKKINISFIWTNRCFKSPCFTSKYSVWLVAWIFENFTKFLSPLSKMHYFLCHLKWRMRKTVCLKVRSRNSCKWSTVFSTHRRCLWFQWWISVCTNHNESWDIWSSVCCSVRSAAWYSMNWCGKSVSCFGVILAKFFRQNV